MRIFVLILFILSNNNIIFSQNSFIILANNDNYKQQVIKVVYGNQTISVIQESTQFNFLSQKRESVYSSKELSLLKIKVLSDVTYLNDHLVYQHQIELSSTEKLAQDLTIYFPVKTLDNFDKILMPLKNGTIYQSGNMETSKIASYRCAGKPEKYAQDLALPLLICSTGEMGTAILTDPYFTSLYDKGSIRWTYPKEVGFEDSVEKRTIIEIEGVSCLDEGMNMYYQTILKDVPAGPNWIKDIAMVSYDYMSDNGKGWYNDIDTLVTLIPLADRKKVALCLHGWYDIIGRYCYNEKTGKLDETWTNRIRGMELSLADLHHRITYAKNKGFKVLMYFADGVLSSKGLPDYNVKEALIDTGYLWNGPDVLGGSYPRNIATSKNYNFYIKYAKALFTEFTPQVDGFVWDETFYIKMGHLGSRQYPSYLDRTQMRLVKEITSSLHSIAPNKAFFVSDAIGEEKEVDTTYGGNIPPYALLADGCYQDSHNGPSFWSYGIFPNYRNVIWSCNWTPLTNFRYTVFGVYAYNTPVVFTNGWGDDRGFSEMSIEEQSNFINLFNYRKQFRTKLKGLYSLPPYFEFMSSKI